jgi:hypothetical protein
MRGGGLRIEMKGWRIVGEGEIDDHALSHCHSRAVEPIARLEILGIIPPLWPFFPTA